MSVVEGPFYFLIFIGVHVPATELVWRSEGNFVESVFPSTFTWVTGIELRFHKNFYPCTHLTGLLFLCEGT